MRGKEMLIKTKDAIGAGGIAINIFLGGESMRKPSPLLELPRCVHSSRVIGEQLPKPEVEVVYQPYILKFED